MANQIDFILRNGLQVTNNVVVGSYTMVNTAPNNGMIVSGSVGIGTASPTQKLQVVGNIQITNSAGLISGIYFADGTYQNTSALSYSTPAQGPTNSVQYNSGLGFGGSANFTFHSGNSHVGIGTSEAKYILDVQATDGPAKFATLNGSDYQVWVGNNTPSGNTAVFGFSNANQYAYITTGNNQPTPILIATQSGNVGIGTNTAANKLDVFGAVATGTYANTLAPTNGLIVSGSVGIGVTNPTSKLAVVAGASAVGFIVKANATPGDFDQYQDSNGAVKWSINSSGNVATGGWAGNAIMANYGGTGLTSYTTGDLLYSSGSSTTLAKLAIGSTGNVLVVSGGIPAWGNVSLSGNGISGTLPISKGGTNVTSFSGNAFVVTSTNGLVMSSVISSTNAAVVFNNSGVPTSVTGGPYTYLTPGAGGGALTFAKVDVANGVTGTLALANGGTGIPSIPQYALLYGSGNTVSYSTLLSSATSALVTSSTNAPQWVSGTVANRVLRTDGTSITFSQVALTTDVSGILPLANGGTNASLTAANGGIVYSTSGNLAISNPSALFFNNTSGFFGIGTNAPAAYLDVNGNAIIRNGGNIVAGGLYVRAGVGNFASSVIANSLTSNSFINGASVYSSGPMSAVGSITSATFTANTSIISPYINATTSANVNGITSNTSVIVNGTVDSTNTLTGAVVVAGGVGIGGNLHVGGATHLIGNVLISGNLNVTGNVTTINTDQLSVEDPLIQIGTGPNGAPLPSDDGFDRGMIMHYYDTTDNHSYLGREDNSGRLLFVTNVQPGITNIANPILSNSPGYAWGTAQFGNLILSGAANSLSTSTSTGALVIEGAGGVGIGGGLHVGAFAYVAQGFNTGGTATVDYLISNSGISSTVLSTSGGISASTITSNNWINGASITSSGTISAAGQITGQSLYSNSTVTGETVSAFTLNATDVNASGVISLTGTSANTITTSATTGALIVQGGIATQSNLWVDASTWLNNLSILSSNVSTSTTTGAVTIAGGLGVVGNVFAGRISTANSGQFGNVGITNTTATTSSTTGALIVQGGVGIVGNLFVNASTWLNNLSILSSNVSTSTTTGAVIIAGGLGVVGNIFAGRISTANSGQFGNIGITNTTATTSSTTGALIVQGGIATQNNLFVNASTWLNNLSILSSNVSTSTTTGAVTVAGGIGVVGNVFAGRISTANSGEFGNVGINNTTVSTSTTTGALIVQGGVGVVGNVFAGRISTANSGQFGNIGISNTTASTNSTTGALIVQGGVGVVGNLFVGGNITARSIDATAIGNITPSTGQFTSAIIQNGLTAGSIASNTFVSGTSLYSSGPISAVGNASFANLTSNGFVNGASVYSSGAISAVGTITGANVVSNGFVQGASIYSSGPISAVGNGTFANVTSNAAIVGATVQGSTSMRTGTFVANTSVTTTSMLASGTATVQTLVSNTSINGNTFILNGNVATTATTGALVLDSFATATYRTAHYIVQVTDNTNSQYHATQIMLIHNGTTVFQSEYNIIYSNAVLGTFDSVVSAGTVQLQFTASAATNKTIKVLRTAVIT